MDYHRILCSFLKMGLFLVYFRLFNMSQFKIKFELIKALLVCLGFKPEAAE